MSRLQELFGERRTYELGLTTDIGRDPGSEVPVSDILASRNHAEIRRGPDGRYRIVDLHSTHGTFLGGERIVERLLQNDDEILIGTRRFRFIDEDAEGSEEPTAVVQERLDVGAQDELFPHEADVGSELELRESYEKLRAAYAITQGMRLEGGLDGLLEKIVDTALALLQADRAAILLVDSKTGQPELRIAKDRDGRPVEVVLSRSILREVMQNKVGVVSADAGADQRFGKAMSVLSTGIRSAMCVPLLHRGELLGVLHCDTLLATNVFRNTDLRLFRTIAGAAAMAVRNAVLLQRVQEEARTRLQFQRFFSPGVVEQIVGGQLRMSRRGQMLPITVLFMDIRGFTRMSEKMAPEAIVDLLNDYFETMVEVLFRHEGTLDKFVGDELMALFGAPNPLADAPAAAVRCAVDMLAALERFNERQRANQGPMIEVGVGIHSGDALCGIIGSLKTRQYTAMGDAVNTAARLCSLARPGQVLISEQTFEAVRGRVRAREQPPTRVKGKSKALRTYDVVSFETSPP